MIKEILTEDEHNGQIPIYQLRSNKVFWGRENDYRDSIKNGLCIDMSDFDWRYDDDARHTKAKALKTTAKCE